MTSQAATPSSFHYTNRKDSPIIPVGEDAYQQGRRAYLDAMQQAQDEGEQINMEEVLNLVAELDDERRRLHT